jgi:hypothetical protein
MRLSVARTATPVCAGRWDQITQRVQIQTVRRSGGLQVSDAGPGSRATSRRSPGLGPRTRPCLASPGDSCRDRCGAGRCLPQAPTIERLGRGGVGHLPSPVRQQMSPLGVGHGSVIEPDHPLQRVPGGGDPSAVAGHAEVSLNGGAMLGRDRA